MGGKKVTSIEDYIRRNSCGSEAFVDAVASARTYMMQAYGVHFVEIPLERWYLIEELGVDKAFGFHSENSFGFFDLYFYGFSVAPKADEGLEDFVVGLELARCYLHDCFHASCFRSYVVKHGEGPKSGITAHRYQYGFNFRDIKGISYSAPMSALRHPGFINLNLLMDGIGSIVTGECIAWHLRSDDLYVSSTVDEKVQDILCNHPSPEGENFYSEVIRPTKEFLRYWKIESLEYFLHGMFSGDVESLYQHAYNRYGINWKSLFKQEAFLALK